MTRPGMAESYGDCLRRFGAVLLVGALMWAALIYGAYRLVSWWLR